MITGVLLVAAPQTSPAAVTPNTMAIPNNVYDRWPAPPGTPGRWMNGPSDKAPFAVVTSVRAGQIAVRWALDPLKRGSPEALYYVAMRQTEEALQEADSRECPIAPVLADLRALPTPEIIVPGTLPIQELAGPPFGHGGVSIDLRGARQADGEYADILLASTSGPIAEWVPKLFEATKDCWKPMTPSAPFPTRAD